MAPIRQRDLEVGDLSMHLLEAGPETGEPVLLLHGFPELAYSWRHQLTALGEAGHRVVAPDMRGFGGTTGAPAAVEAYDILHLTGDVVGLLDALDAPQGVVIGHDWGADAAWKTAWMHPERVRAVAGLSVPFAPRAPAPPVAIFRENIGEDFYMVWFQVPGVADAVLGRDVRRTLRAREVWTADWAGREDDLPRPPWLSAADEEVYVEAFSRTGFTGGLNWYRNIDRNWEETAHVAERRIEQPALFLTGSRDPVTAFMPHQVMDGWVTDLREVVVLDGAGHWVQQERPEEVSAALERFLASVA
jgi:pimeloyl-ACP methyl ester carboxylesterase